MLAIARDRTLDELREQQRAALLEVFQGTATPLLAIDDEEQLIAANPALGRLLRSGGPGERATRATCCPTATTRRGSPRPAPKPPSAARPRPSWACSTPPASAASFTIFVVETAERDLPTAFLLVFVESAQLPSNP